MRKVANIADDLLKIAKRKGMELTPMQLNKLCYIAYGWHSVMPGEKLFEDQIQAWKYGPVIPKLYHGTKHFGRNPIPFSQIENEDVLTHPDLEDLLEEVVEEYGKFAGIVLSSFTHRPGTPWDKFYRQGKLNIEIPYEEIKEHYEELNERAKAKS